MKYALINEDGLVINIIIWDGISEVQWPDGFTVVPVTPELEFEFNRNNVSGKSEQLPLSDEEMEFLRSLLNRMNPNG